MPNSGAKHATLKGAGGGSWGPCTHLVKYGLNVEPRYAKSLAALLRQIEGTTALEFGCGLGLYSSYLAKSGAAAGDVVGIEPDADFQRMWRRMGLLASDGRRPRQAAFDVTRATASELRAHAVDGTFDLVHSNEVIEHIPRSLHDAVFDFIAARVSRLLVVGVARPDQLGHGHIACRTPAEVRAELLRRGLTYLPNTTRALQDVAINKGYGRARRTKVYSQSILLQEKSELLLATVGSPRARGAAVRSVRARSSAA